MSGINIGKALRRGNGPLRRALDAPSQRTFSSSTVCQKHGQVPKFTETSSHELDSILSTFRHKVFLPEHLSHRQKELIFASKNRKLLEIEPINARISGEVFHLQHIDRVTDLPATWPSFTKALDLMKEKKDWDNVPALLTGLRNANRPLKAPYAAILVRKAALAGRMDVILECARQTAGTGFRLNDPELVAMVMWGLQYKAFAANFAERETKQALAWAEMVLIMLEEQRHMGKVQIVGLEDPRTKLEVVGAPLMLAADRASKHLEGKDEDGMVAMYAERILPTTLQSKLEGDGVFASQTWLSLVVPNLHGMMVAQSILDPSSILASNLKKKTDELRASVEEQLAIIQKAGQDAEQPCLGVKLYNQLLRPAVS